jgi:hypothetical protein
VSIKIYSRVKFIGPIKEYPDLLVGDIGYVIEDYEDGNYEVEFSSPDGSTRVQAVIPESYLVVAEI